jgi:hypothetical protein
MCDKDFVRISRRQMLAAAVVASVRPARAEDAVDPYRWIGGLGRPPYDSAEWDDYVRLEEERWKSDEGRIRAMRAWADRETAPLVANG